MRSKSVRANVARTAHRLGIASNLDANPTIALGTSVVSPLELVSAYVPFANGGISVTPYVVTKVAAAHGKLLYFHRPDAGSRVIAPEYVAMMNRMMAETLATGTARRVDLPGWPAAGKTGTSQDFRDAWFVGYTSHMVCGVWLGNDDNSPTKRASGGSLPVVVWSHFMQVAHADLPPAPLTDGVWTAPRPAEPIASATNAIVNFFTGQNQPAPARPALAAAAFSILAAGGPNAKRARIARRTAKTRMTACRRPQFPRPATKRANSPSRSFFGLF